MVAIVGADGSGKTSVLCALAENFRHQAVRNIYILNRFGRKRQTTGPIQNYEKPPRGSLISIAKLFIYTLYWVVLFYFKIVPLKRSGTLILCDHFYFLGAMLDPLKYRYGGPASLPVWITRLVPKPDIFILLDAPCEQLHQRKQEINLDELEILINKHREYILGINNGYVIDACDSIECVTTQISQIINQAIKHTKRKSRIFPLVNAMFC